MRCSILAAAALLSLVVSANALAGQPKIAKGTVAAIGANSMTIRAGPTEMRFAVDNRTQVVGKGIGARASANGGKASFLELVGLGDRVSVTYREVAGSLHASDIRVTGKGAR